MFLGHGLLAFAIVALAGRRAGWPRDRVLALGALGFAFATLPDIDVLYALGGLAAALNGPFAATAAFWAESTLVHRTVTHSLPVAVVAAVGFACWHAALSSDGTRRLAAGSLGLGALGALVTVGLLVSGPLAAAILSALALVGLVLTTVAGRRLSWLTPRAVVTTAALGLVSHPFGDLFTGEPPAFLYPFDITLIAERVVLHPDPTLHLLAAFGIELATIWLALAAYVGLSGGRMLPNVGLRALVGVGYAGAALALPAPTLDVSYHFVFSVLAVGAIGFVEAPGVGFAGRFRRATTDGGRATGAGVRVADRTAALTTALAAVTLAAVGYTLVYLLM